MNPRQRTAASCSKDSVVGGEETPELRAKDLQQILIRHAAAGAIEDEGSVPLGRDFMLGRESDTTPTGLESGAAKATTFQRSVHNFSIE